MIWQVVCQAGAEDNFIPVLQAREPRLLVALDKPGSPHHVSNKVLETLREDGLELQETVIDLLYLAMCVYAADMRIQRRFSEDKWARDFIVHFPAVELSRWRKMLPTITRMLSFLTGDKWTIRLRQRTPAEGAVRRAADGGRPDVVSLFSGGLDSFVGAVDLLEEHEGLVALVGQYGKGSANPAQVKSYQVIADAYQKKTRRFGFFVQPPKLEGQGAEDSMRSRSILFLALGTAVASACGTGTPLHIPENGLISLNVPLTHSRMGSLSTRTTHPHFIALYRETLAGLGIKVRVELPYRFHTKGEMLKGVKNHDVLRRGLPVTLSCARPDAGRYQKRSPGTHCGYCVPCLIRLASMKAAGFSLKGAVFYDAVGRKPDPQTTRGSDVRAFEIALERVRNLAPLQLAAEVLSSGPLPPDEIQAYAGVYQRGMEEVGRLLQSGRGR